MKYTADSNSDTNMGNRGHATICVEKGGTLNIKNGELSSDVGSKYTLIGADGGKITLEDVDIKAGNASAVCHLQTDNMMLRI